MTVAREALVLPAVFLTVLLLGALRIADTVVLVPPSPFALVLGALLLRVVVQSGALDPGRLLSSSRPGLANLNGTVVTRRAVGGRRAGHRRADSRVGRAATRVQRVLLRPAAEHRRRLARSPAVVPEPRRDARGGVRSEVRRPLSVVGAGGGSAQARAAGDPRYRHAGSADPGGAAPDDGVHRAARAGVVPDRPVPAASVARRSRAWRASSARRFLQVLQVLQVFQVVQALRGLQAFQVLEGAKRRAGRVAPRRQGRRSRGHAGSPGRRIGRRGTGADDRSAACPRRDCAAGECD